MRCNAWVGTQANYIQSCKMEYKPGSNGAIPICCHEHPAYCAPSFKMCATALHWFGIQYSPTVHVTLMDVELNSFSQIQVRVSTFHTTECKVSCLNRVTMVCDTDCTWSDVPKHQCTYVQDPVFSTQLLIYQHCHDVLASSLIRCSLLVSQQYLVQLPLGEASTD